MTSSSSATLLNQPATRTEPTHDMPRPAAGHRAAPMRSVTHVVAAPQPMPHYVPAPYVQQPQVQVAPRPRGSRIASIALALVVLLVGAVALVGGWYATVQASPTERERTVTEGIAMREGYAAGRTRGIESGRSDALAQSSMGQALKAATQREAAYARAYARGRKAGLAYRPARASYGGGYRSTRPRISMPFGGEVYAARQFANAWSANTGAPVVVETYN